MKGEIVQVGQGDLDLCVGSDFFLIDFESLFVMRGEPKPTAANYEAQYQFASDYEGYGCGHCSPGPKMSTQEVG